jgi:hypothetical protein
MEWFLITLIMAIASVVGVFIFIPLVSANAFWILTDLQGSN